MEIHQKHGTIGSVLGRRIGGEGDPWTVETLPDLVSMKKHPPRFLAVNTTMGIDSVKYSISMAYPQTFYPYVGSCKHP